jgi:WD40 repeat protein
MRSAPSRTFSADGSRVVTGSDDNTAKVWDARPYLDSRPPDLDIAPPPREVKRTQSKID